ncbi:MAG: hypothetical protein LBS88_04250 [Tannerellaceae bacterium]|jgi:hypothetical protein|nr:hypothetical protein [Tannerellaceae bacterium]
MKRIGIVLLPLCVFMSEVCFVACVYNITIFPQASLMDILAMLVGIGAMLFGAWTSLRMIKGKEGQL